MTSVTDQPVSDGVVVDRLFDDRPIRQAGLDGYPEVSSAQVVSPVEIPQDDPAPPVVQTTGTSDALDEADQPAVTDSELPT